MFVCCASQEDYDELRNRLEPLANEVQELKGTNELLVADKAALATELDTLKADKSAMEDAAKQVKWCFLHDMTS